MMDRQSHRSLALRRVRETRRESQSVGVCHVCGVGFAGRIEQLDRVREVLRVHESICPGGTRSGHVVEPFT